MSNLGASSPKWANADQSAIDLMVIFPHIGPDPVPFTASPDDSMAYGRNLYQRAVSGEFGEIAPADPAPPPPVPDEISDRQFFQQLAAAGIITKSEALAAVRTGDLPASMVEMLASIEDDDQRFAAEIILSGATQFRRDHGLVGFFAGAMGWTSEQVDDLFRAAAAL
jgi:hypothetical protein